MTTKQQILRYVGPETVHDSCIPYFSGYRSMWYIGRSTDFWQKSEVEFYIGRSGI